jgi:hypothetical protein
MSVLIQGPRAAAGVVQLAEATVLRTCSLQHHSQDGDMRNLCQRRQRYAAKPNALHPVDMWASSHTSVHPHR